MEIAMSLSREEVTALVEGYLKAVESGDVDRIMSLFSRDAVLEDPIGSEPKQDPDAIRAFYAKPRNYLLFERLGVVSVSGNNAGFAFHIELEIEGRNVHAYVHEMMRFDDEGKITSMLALPDFGIKEQVTATYGLS
jgi:steroid Delta-isomerase